MELAGFEFAYFAGGIGDGNDLCNVEGGGVGGGVMVSQLVCQSLVLKYYEIKSCVHDTDIMCTGLLIS